jgi:hypothetical protein
LTAASRPGGVQGGSPHVSGGGGPRCRRGRDPALAQQARDAFVHAVSVGSLAGCGATLATALFAAVVLRGVPRPASAPAGVEKVADPA